MILFSFKLKAYTFFKWISPKYSEVSNEFKWKYNHEAETDVFAALNFDCLWKLSKNTFGLPSGNFDRGFMYHWYPSDLPCLLEVQIQTLGFMCHWYLADLERGTYWDTLHYSSLGCRWLPAVFLKNNRDATPLKRSASKCPGVQHPQMSM